MVPPQRTERPVIHGYSLSSEVLVTHLFPFVFLAYLLLPLHYKLSKTSVLYNHLNISQLLQVRNGDTDYLGTSIITVFHEVVFKLLAGTVVLMSGKIDFHGVSYNYWQASRP